MNIMKKNRNFFSQLNSEYFYLFLIFASTILFFDILAIFFLFFLFLVSYVNFGIDSVGIKNLNDDKHGINKRRSSRLGGTLILIFLIFNISNYGELNLIIDNPEKLKFYIIIVLFISFLGFADDILNGINYLIKLYFLFFSIIILIITNEEFLITYSGINIIDLLLDNYIISFFVTFMIISGFINASNISDGANGILSGIALFFNLALYLQTNEIFFLILLKFLIIFFLYNIFISNVFLGDSGSYFLGFYISTISLYFYNQNIFSVGFFGCILSYPCLEITFSIFRRLKVKHNPLKPDNRHLHNLIFIFVKKNFLRIKNPNSLTGLLINLLFVFPGFLFYFFTNDPKNIFYWYIFLFHIFIYFITYTITYKAIESE